MSHNCGENSTCVNAFGSYACFCNVGFTESYSLDGKLQCVGVSLMPFGMLQPVLSLIGRHFMQVLTNASWPNKCECFV